MYLVIFFCICSFIVWQGIQRQQLKYKSRVSPKTSEISLNDQRSKQTADFRMIYIDENGQETQREITIRSAERGTNGDIYLNCICLLRKDLRTFRVSRIQELVDIQTGESVDDPVDFFSQRIAS